MDWSLLILPTIFALIITPIIVRKIPRKVLNRSYEQANRERFANQFALLFVGFWVVAGYRGIPEIVAFTGGWTAVIFAVFVWAAILLGRFIYRIKGSLETESISAHVGKDRH